jgi:Ca2+-binding RTX toxin-like protein
MRRSALRAGTAALVGLAVLAAVCAVTASSAFAAGGSALAGSLIAAESPATAAPVVVRGTPDADTIAIAQLPDGSLSVLVTDTRTGTSVRTDVPVADAGHLIVDAGAGADVIEADASVTQPLTVLAGAGDDHVVTGAGADYVDAGTGNDVVDAGAGNDVVYGGPGADQLIGGDGLDYLDGGPGADTISGGAGDDILMGGKDGDALSGGDGADVMAGGAGADTYSGGAGVQRFFAQPGTDRILDGAGAVTRVPIGGTNAAGGPIGSSLALPKAAAMRLRCESDVQALLSLPYGRRLLLALDAAGKHVSIVHSGTGNKTTFLDAAAAVLRASGRRGPGSASVIGYNQTTLVVSTGSANWMHRPPLVGLYHELIHALNAATGSVQPPVTGKRLELQAIGLPFAGIAWDNDGDPSTPRKAGNVTAFTENGLRALLGLDTRTSY